MPNQEEKKIELFEIKVHRSKVGPMQFCYDHLEDIMKLKQLGFFHYKSLGAGSARFHWDNSGRIGVIKDITWVNPPKHLTKG